MASEENLELAGRGSVPAVQIELPNPEEDLPETAEAGELLASMTDLPTVTEGAMARAKVLKVTDDEVLVDVGLKSEVAVPRSEFLTEGGQLTVAAGDVVDVWIDRYDATEGTASVSRQKAARLRIWEEIERASRDQTNIRGHVVERTKGGLIVDVGVRAFLPGSHADLRPLRNLDSLIGQEISCKVIKVIRSRNNVVVSRKAALEEESSRRRAELAEKFKGGAEVVGRVKNLTNYGAFVDLGGVDGLLHITDLSWGRVGHPSEVVKVGQEIKVKILKYDEEKKRVSLGLKQLAQDPWERVTARLHPGDHVSGRVVSLTDYGTFVELEPGVEGLIHVSEMSWSKRPKHPSKILNVGDRIEVTVLDVMDAQRRISLSLRQTLPDPWTALGERLRVGAVVDVTIRNLLDFGAFAEIEEGVDGLIHISDLSAVKRVNHPSEILRKGQRVRAVILNVDPEHRRISLGLKQLEPNPWETLLSKIKVGSVVRGKVVRTAPFGAFVELQEGIDGLCHNSESGEPDPATGKSRIEVEKEYDFEVIRITAEEKKISLRLKDAKVVREVHQEPRKESASTMAEALSAAGIIPASAAPPVASLPALPAKSEQEAQLKTALALTGEVAILKKG